MAKQKPNYESFPDAIIIGVLKKNLSTYGNFTDSEKALSKKIGVEHFVILRTNGKWSAPMSNTFKDNSRYRLRDNYKQLPPKENYEKFPIYKDTRGLLVFDKWGTVKTLITDPETLAKYRFAGYEYPDGKVCGSLRKYKSNRSQTYYTIGLDSLMADDSKTIAVSPVFMVFRTK